MQRTVHDRSSHVLVFGQTPDQYQEWRTMVKDGLQSDHMGWVLTTALVDNIEQMINWIQDHENLEILYITNEAGMNDEVIINGIPKIALALNGHKHQPWVMLSAGVNHLRPYLEEHQAKVVVGNGMIEYVIFHRWGSQIVEEKIADDEEATSL